MKIRTPNTPEEWEEYYNLRYEVLRAPLGKERGSEKNEGDITGEHFAAFRNGEIIAVARLDKVDEHTAQVRFVAVKTNLQGSGVGKLLMNAVENRLVERGFTEMVLHARDYALAFYEKLGYTTIGASYKLFDVLQHYEMRKQF